MDDLISRREAIDALWKALYEYEDKTEKQFQESDELDVGDWINHRNFVQNMNDIDRQTILNLPSAQQWIPVRMRPMDSEEREYWEEHTGYTLTDDMARTFDCPMPDDSQRIWVQTKNGFVFDDVCDSDCDGIGLEGNGDWDDIVAWMPMLVPAPWKGGES